VPAAGGITYSSFSFSPVTLVATLFIDVTVPGHDIPGGRNESSVQSGDVGRLPSSFILLRFRVVSFAKDVASYFRDYFFLLPFFPLFRKINVFPLSFVSAWSNVSDNEGIVDRPAKGPRYSERFISVYPAKRSFSKLVFAGTSQSTVMVFRFPQRALGGKD